MKVAIIGCGYVADFYMATMKYYPELELIGIYDKNLARCQEFQKYYSVKMYPSFQDILNDSSVEIVLNLTNPRDHYEISKQCLEAGKHVYSEKPLSMDFDSAKQLVGLAKEKKLYLNVAPCSLLGNTAQTILKALNEKIVGNVLLVYANFDAGMTSKYQPWKWKSASGALWPAKDEFEIGCTYEHAGYILTWLAAFFGPAKKVTAFASTQIADKGISVANNAADFSVGCVEYSNNIVARVTNSIVAPHDRSLTIVGDKGVLYIKDIRDDNSPVYVKQTPQSRLRNALEQRINYWHNYFERFFNWIPWSWGRYWRSYYKYPLIKKSKTRKSGKYKPVDFCRGLADMVDAIKQNRSPRLSAELGLHIVELIEVLQYPEKFDGKREIASTFEAIKPLY